jgi:pimeloyl-ACP methyl ester carboxylesterase
MRLKLLGTCAALAMAASGAASAQTACAQLKDVSFPDVRITEAVTATSPVAHCKVGGVIGKETNFAVWLPDNWNGKFVMGGQGGFAGSVENQAMTMGALQKGYATAGTDTGHKAATPDGSWALGEMERIVNYAHAAIHRTTEVAKHTVKARYGRPAQKSYFAGCSNGGRQALMSAQRYPNDFDAIVAGAPALDFTYISTGFLTITKAMYPDPANLAAPTLSTADREALGKAVLARCDKSDGLEDGVLSDPLSCKFDPATIACKGANAEGCLSKAEIAAVNAVTRPVEVGGKTYFPGFPFGAEANVAGWGTWLVGRKDMIAPGVPSLAHGFGVGFARYFVKQDPAWTTAKFDAAQFAKDAAFMTKTLSANDPDLSAFRGRGGKLLMYHGWADAALSPMMSTGYVDQVYAKDATARNDVRLFMMPGVLHCTGGTGPDRVDYLDIIDKWANGGGAPDELTAGFASGGGGRKLCAYPKKAVFAGTGDGRDPAQFRCE